jgi:hypothetical protein
MLRYVLAVLLLSGSLVDVQALERKQAIGEFLQAIDFSMTQYAEGMEERGLSDVDSIVTATVEDVKQVLEQLKVKKAHRRLILHAKEEAQAEQSAGGVHAHDYSESESESESESDGSSDNTAPADASEWHYIGPGIDSDKQYYGPVTYQALVGLYNDKTINDGTSCWKKGMKEWIPYSKLENTATSPASTEASASKTSTSDAGAITDDVDYAAEVQAIYQEHNPEKLKDADFVSKTLKRYEGKEVRLLKKLRRKFDIPEPEELKKVEVEVSATGEATAAKPKANMGPWFRAGYGFTNDSGRATREDETPLGEALMKTSWKKVFKLCQKGTVKKQRHSIMGIHCSYTHTPYSVHPRYTHTPYAAR